MITYPLLQLLHLISLAERSWSPGGILIINLKSKYANPKGAEQTASVCPDESVSVVAGCRVIYLISLPGMGGEMFR